jgi:RimJ/RimL family protein N-acetyltransferase
VERYTHKAKDGTKVVFREPRPDDSKALMDFINGFVDQERSGLLISKRTNIREERKWLGARLSEIKAKKTVMLLVERDGRIVGNCDVSRRMWKEAHRAVLGIALSKEIQGKGIGEKLIGRVVRLAKRRMKGLERIDLQVIDYNDRAKRLYKKVGFVKVARMPEAVKEGGEYYAEDWMVMKL